MKNLELKSGAISLLQALKKHGKKIAIITEGTQDGATTTLKQLGIASYMDFVGSASTLGKKPGPMFGKALKTLSIQAADMAYIASNRAGDLKPASAHGIFTIHLAERRDVDLDADVPRINTLNKLQFILEDRDVEDVQDDLATQGCVVS